MTDFIEGTPPASRGTAAIENDIRLTRDRMGMEIEAIGDKFRPARIKQRAKAAVSRKGENLFRTAKENPLPTAIVALGLTLLFKARAKNGHSRDLDVDDMELETHESAHGLKQKTQDLAGNAKEKVQDVAGAARDKVSHAAEQVSEKAKRTGNKLQQFFEDNPLIASAGVVVLGAAIGALIPETQNEKDIMGHARDEVVGKAKSVAQHAQGTFEQKMSERQPIGAGSGMGNRGEGQSQR